MPTPKGAGEIDLGIRSPPVKSSVADAHCLAAAGICLPAGTFHIDKQESDHVHDARRDRIGPWPTDETLIADILYNGASFEELREAWVWLNEDEALISKDGRCRARALRN